MKKMLLTLCLALGFGLPAVAETVHVTVNGLVCAFCVKGIEDSFKKNESVASVAVDLDKKLVTLVTKDDAVLDDAAINATISQAGYNVTNIHHQP